MPEGDMLPFGDEGFIHEFLRKLQLPGFTDAQWEQANIPLGSGGCDPALLYASRMTAVARIPYGEDTEHAVGHF